MQVFPLHHNYYPFQRSVNEGCWNPRNVRCVAMQPSTHHQLWTTTLPSIYMGLHLDVSHGVLVAMMRIQSMQNQPMLLIQAMLLTRIVLWMEKSLLISMQRNLTRQTDSATSSYVLQIEL